MASDEAGWWEVERARFILERVSHLTWPGAVAADVGCGRGVMLTDETLGDRVVVNVDSYRWSSWNVRPGVRYVLATADALPFRDGSLDLVGSFDVLEHLADDDVALREQARVVRPGGHVVSAVPADPRLWSAHDEAVGHHRRYDKATFETLASKSGLHVIHATHFFSFLWLPALLTRRRAQARSEPGTGSGLLSRGVRQVVALCCAGERWLMRRWNLPFGTSLWFESRPIGTERDGR
jgi:SAM-dependent methyltransferase